METASNLVIYSKMLVCSFFYFSNEIKSDSFSWNLCNVKNYSFYISVAELRSHGRGKKSIVR